VVDEAGEWVVARLAGKPDPTMRALTEDLPVRDVRVAHQTVSQLGETGGPGRKKDLLASKQMLLISTQK
jgi:hypothetical protein